jgi:hypothetical protein
MPARARFGSARRERRASLRSRNGTARIVRNSICLAALAERDIEAVGRPAVLCLSIHHLVKVPPIGNALQLVLARILERKA